MTGCLVGEGRREVVGLSYLSLSSTPPSGNGPRWREAGAEEGRELSFSFTSPGEEAKRRLLSLLLLLFCAECNGSSSVKAETLALGGKALDAGGWDKIC